MMKSKHRHMMGKPEMKEPVEQKMKEGQETKAVDELDKTTLSVTKKNQ